jgi:hypothetical protein
MVNYRNPITIEILFITFPVSVTAAIESAGLIEFELDHPTEFTASPQ